MLSKKAREICLFDMDGTLSLHKAPISNAVIRMIQEVDEVMDVGIVSGARHEEVKRIIKLCLPKVRYIFAENGCIAYDRNKCLLKDSITRAVPEEVLDKLIETLFMALQLHEAEIQEVWKALVASGNRDEAEPVRITRELVETWTDRRAGLWNVTLLGKVPSHAYRKFLSNYLKEYKIREKVVDTMYREYGEECPWRIACGGAVSIDIYPVGWDKTRCLEHLPEDVPQVFFFGDQTESGGNDYELYNHKRTNAFKVDSVGDTIKKVYRNVLRRPCKKKKMIRERRTRAYDPTSASSKIEGVSCTNDGAEGGSKMNEIVELLNTNNISNVDCTEKMKNNLSLQK